MFHAILYRLCLCMSSSRFILRSCSFCAMDVLSGSLHFCLLCLKLTHWPHFFNPTCSPVDGILLTLRLPTCTTFLVGVFSVLYTLMIFFIWIYDQLGLLTPCMLILKTQRYIVCYIE